MKPITTPEPLTPEQVENWRKTLFGMIGPYALIVSVEQIQKIRDRFQEEADKQERAMTQPTPEQQAIELISELPKHVRLDLFFMGFDKRIAAALAEAHQLLQDACNTEDRCRKLLAAYDKSSPDGVVPLDEAVEVALAEAGGAQGHPSNKYYINIEDGDIWCGDHRIAKPTSEASGQLLVQILNTTTPAGPQGDFAQFQEGYKEGYETALKEVIMHNVERKVAAVHGDLISREAAMRVIEDHQAQLVCDDNCWTEIKKGIRALPVAAPTGECVWKQNKYQDYWDTSCDEVHAFEAGGPADNKQKWCGYCGRKLVEAGKKEGE